MKAILNIVIDISGSMNEMGKIHLQRNLCRYVAQLQLIEPEKYANFNIHFYQWAQDVSQITVQSDGDIPAIYTEGTASLDVLVDFLFRNLSITQRALLLVISDGHFTKTDILNFQSQLSSLADLNIRTVAVGADADLLKLKKISSNNSVYLSENIASAIDSTIFGSDEPLMAPVSTAQILQSSPAETEELEEDWDA